MRQPNQQPDQTDAGERQARRAQLYDAAGVPPARMPADAVRVIEWLTGKDDWTAEAVAQLLEAARGGERQ